MEGLEQENQVLREEVASMKTKMEEFTSMKTKMEELTLNSPIFSLILFLFV